MKCSKLAFCAAAVRLNLYLNNWEIIFMCVVLLCTFRPTSLIGRETLIVFQVDVCDVAPHPQVSPTAHRPRSHTGCAVQVMRASDEKGKMAPPRD